MSEYNIQMNKYNALNTEYDQLYPATKIKNVDGLDTALQNKAPAGYGLGTYGRPLGANDDLNNIIKNGWYYWSTNMPANAITPWSAMIINALNDGHIVQTIYPFSMPGTRVIRVCTGGIWKPDEYENPPMRVGGMDENGNPINEYRTTERYLGKPVYVQTKEISALAIGSSSSPARTDIEDFTDTCDKIVRYEMYVTPASGGPKFPIPFIEATTGVLKASGSLNEGQYLYGSIYSFDDLSGYKANVTCWYTKTTDQGGAS